nr:hypothetical protein [Paenibacillus xylanexedens]
MSNVNKGLPPERPAIPAEVADVIEGLRDPESGHVFSNAEITAQALNTGGTMHIDTVTLRKIPFDTLLAALVNGYEREKTPEETVRDMYEGFKEREGWLPERYGHDYGAGTARRAIEVTLNTLGIKIKGVNANE